MKLGLHIAATNWQGDAARLGAALGEVIDAAEAARFGTISVNRPRLGQMRWARRSRIAAAILAGLAFSLPALNRARGAADRRTA